MFPPLKIAWRYFRAPKSAQAINIISWISIVAISIASGAMIVLFSVFNGLEAWTIGLYNRFYPELKVAPVKGKFFDVSNRQLQAIKSIKGIQTVAAVAEDMVLLNTDEEQQVATLKGVDNNWFKVCALDATDNQGKEYYWPETTKHIPAIMGISLASNLGIDVNNVFSLLKIQYPKPNTNLTLDVNDALNDIIVKPEQTFSSLEEIDHQYIIVPLAAAQYLYGIKGAVSALEIKTDGKTSESKIKEQVLQILGAKIKVENSFEQNKTLYMIMKGEKWAVYAILTFVLLIASFNMIGALSMVVMEKRKDVAILRSMGATTAFIRTLFLLEGMVLALVGAAIGVGLGLLLCVIQQQFGLVKLSDAFEVKYYPVVLSGMDVVLVLFTVSIIGLLASWYPANKAAKLPVFLREE